jgi:hypothetical protein
MKLAEFLFQKLPQDVNRISLMLMVITVILLIVIMYRI